MSQSRCLLTLVFLGSITLVPVTSWASASICDAVSGNVVMNCGFETGDFSHWTVTPAAIGSHLFVDTHAHSGNDAAGFGAVGGLDDSISQPLTTTTAGRSFVLSFFLTNVDNVPPGRADFSTSWDGTKLFSASTSVFPYTKFSFVVPGHGFDTLQFASHGSIYLLDDIVVTPAAVVIPEPSTLSLFGLGLLFGAALLWRKGVQARGKTAS